MPATERAEREHIAIRPPAKRVGLGLRDVWRHRELLYFLSWRDLKVRYKQSVVGIGWALIQPLAMMVIFIVVFDRVAGIRSDLPGPLFYFAALVPWTYFQQAVNASTNSLVTNGPLVAKVYFPRILLPLSSVLSSLVDLGIAFVFLVAIAAYYLITGDARVELGPRLLAIPGLVVLIVATALASGTWLSALNARYRDVRYAVGFILQLWLFVSPVAYASDHVPDAFQTVYALNPVAGAIDGFRWAFGSENAPGVGLAISAAVATVWLVLGTRYFRKYEGNVADVI